MRNQGNPSGFEFKCGGIQDGLKLLIKQIANTDHKGNNLVIFSQIISIIVLICCSCLSIYLINVFARIRNFFNQNFCRYCKIPSTEGNATRIQVFLNYTVKDPSIKNQTINSNENF